MTRRLRLVTAARSREVTVLATSAVDQIDGHPIILTFDRRYHRKQGTGYWGDAKLPHDPPWLVGLTVPPLASWTRDTVLQIVDTARAQLVARGATGARRVRVTVDDWCLVSSVAVSVRVGDLRARLRIDAGTVRYELPHAILTALAELAPNATINTAVKCARAARGTADQATRDGR